MKLQRPIRRRKKGGGGNTKDKTCSSLERTNQRAVLSRKRLSQQPCTSAEPDKGGRRASPTSKERKRGFGITPIITTLYVSSQKELIPMRKTDSEAVQRKGKLEGEDLCPRISRRKGGGGALSLQAD